MSVYAVSGPYAIQEKDCSKHLQLGQHGRRLLGLAHGSIFFDSTIVRGEGL